MSKLLMHTGAYVLYKEDGAPVNEVRATHSITR